MTITRLSFADIAPVSALVGRVFDEHVAPLYPPEGCEEFHRFIAPAALQERLSAGPRGWIAREEGVPVGVLVLRDGDHVALFFVKTARQRAGVGRALLVHGAADAAARGHEALTVNASPNAVGAYVALGFLPAGPSQEKNGITFLPMTRPLDDFRGRSSSGDPDLERLPGPAAVLVCGYGAVERETLRLFLGVVFVDPPALCPVSAASPERTVAEVLGAPEDATAPGCERLPRVVLLSGCTLAEARGVIDQWSASGLSRPVFAVTTGRNLGFQVRELVAHLLEEERVMRAAAGAAPADTPKSSG
jgi:GNAT superfamily N-acetyltransferase